MRRIRIRHVTEYSYPHPVRLLEHKLLVRPREGHDIRIESSLLEIQPAYSIFWRRDVYGNSVGIVNFTEDSDHLRVTSEVVVQHYEEQALDCGIDQAAVVFPFRYDPMEQVDLIPYQLSSFPQDNLVLRQWVHKIWKPGEIIETLELLGMLSSAVVADFGYEIRTDPGVQSPAATLQRGKGACRDLATLFIESCRYCGLAARFVSGYLVSSAVVKDYSATHAWAEIYLPGVGWRGYDSTSGQLVGGDHIAVAVNRRPDGVPPISGSFIAPAEPRAKMEVDVAVNLL
jgi:transglutaminase-like putative cysteine protease